MRRVSYFLPVVLLLCFLPIFSAPKISAPQVTITPTVKTPCAFIEGRKTLDDISKQLLDKLKKVGVPVENARAEAYGENCVNVDGSVERFAIRETDFYITFLVPDLADEAQLGDLLEQALTVIDQFPPGQTPGPNPGYVGITFKAGEKEKHLWFAQAQVKDLRKQGLKGITLYQALAGKP